MASREHHPFKPRIHAMCRLTALYGHPKDPAAFDRYYHEVHLPIARRMQGIKGWTIGKCQSAVAGQPPPYYMIVGLYADTRAHWDAILASPEGKATIEDVARFATGGCSFLFDDEVVLVPYALA
jgi:uncharacterized protein (TIGR02118 family)